MRRLRPRKFNYTPMYLKTEKEAEGGKRIKFKRFITVNRGRSSVYKLMILVVLLLFFLYSLPKITGYFFNLFNY